MRRLLGRFLAGTHATDVDVQYSAYYTPTDDTEGLVKNENKLALGSTEVSRQMRSNLCSGLSGSAVTEEERSVASGCSSATMVDTVGYKKQANVTGKDDWADEPESGGGWTWLAVLLPCVVLLAATGVLSLRFGAHRAFPSCESEDEDDDESETPPLLHKRALTAPALVTPEPPPRQEPLELPVPVAPMSVPSLPQIPQPNNYTAVATLQTLPRPPMQLPTAPAIPAPTQALSGSMLEPFQPLQTLQQDRYSVGNQAEY